MTARALVANPLERLKNEGLRRIPGAQRWELTGKRQRFPVFGRLSRSRARAGARRAPSPLLDS